MSDVKAPPVKYRPKCRYCLQSLRPVYGGTYIPGTLRFQRTHVEGYGYMGHGLFCSLRCGYSYGERAAR